MIEHIYICHYSKLIDRKIHMEKQIKETGLDKICPITWIEHFDREKITLYMIRENYIHIPEILSRLCSVPEIANAMSHNYAITQISEKYNCAMMLLLLINDCNKMLTPNLLRSYNDLNAK